MKLTIIFIIVAISIYIYISNSGNEKIDPVTTLNHKKKSSNVDTSDFSLKRPVVTVINRGKHPNDRGLLNHTVSNDHLYSESIKLSYENIENLLESYIDSSEPINSSYVQMNFHKKIANPNSIKKIIDLYNLESEPTKKGKLSVLLSSIDTDEKLNKFSDNIDYQDKSMIADFFSATLKTNTQNSIRKLFGVLGNINEADIYYHLSGLSLIYSKSDSDRTLGYIENDINNNGFYYTPNQEKFILQIIQRSSYNVREDFIKKFGGMFYDQLSISILRKELDDGKRQ